MSRQHPSARPKGQKIYPQDQESAPSMHHLDLVVPAEPNACGHGLASREDMNYRNPKSAMALREYAFVPSRALYNTSLFSLFILVKRRSLVRLCDRSKVKIFRIWHSFHLCKPCNIIISVPSKTPLWSSPVFYRQINESTTLLQCHGVSLLQFTHPSPFIHFFIRVY